jgi:8-oxo-dGTP diphosphatase/2-hydroxy-dATP diphosphatase
MRRLSTEWNDMTKLLTLCIAHQDGKVLLGMKKRGFGQGRWNGFGGKVEAGETVEQAARREVQEEVGLSSLSLRKRGVLTFEFENDPELLEVHVFKITEFRGRPTESEEMRPEWFVQTKIPFEQMWPDDKFWMPLFLRDKFFRGRFMLKDHNTILKQELEEVDEL